MTVAGTGGVCLTGRRSDRSGRGSADPPYGYAVAAVAAREPDVGFDAKPAGDLRGSIRESLEALVRPRQAFVAEAMERRSPVPQPDHLPVDHPATAARSVNLVYRRRNESLIESVGPFRCFARWISASPC